MELLPDRKGEGMDEKNGRERKGRKWTRGREHKGMEGGGKGGLAAPKSATVMRRRGWDSGLPPPKYGSELHKNIY